MNFLAHFFLSNKIENIVIGNFLGDFVRGNKYKDYPEEIAKGIMLHRNIDTFTDTHPIVLRTNKRLHANFGKYAPVITDIYYDHFLGIHFQEYEIILKINQEFRDEGGKKIPRITNLNYDWFLQTSLGISEEEFCKNKKELTKKVNDEVLSKFSSFIYQTLEKNYEILPPLAQQVFLKMREQDWLTHYATLYGMEQSLNGISKRAKYATHLHESYDFLKQNYSTIENDFLLFFPDIMQFVHEKLNE